MIEQAIPASVFTPANMDGCALYRMYVPHLNIAKSRFVFKEGPVPYELFAQAEVIVVQRQVSQQNFIALNAIRDNGFKVVYDTDDNLWNLPAANPSKQIFDAHRENFSRCATLANVITVSTAGLKSAVKTALPRFDPDKILICPNAMDFNLFTPPSVERDPDRVVIGWAGSNTHGEDVREAWDVLPAIVEEFPNVYMEFIGQAPPEKLHDHPRVRVRRFMPVGEFPSRLASWGWDITLAPIADNRFNRSKSNIKMLEAGALGIPILVSHVQPYQEFCALGKLDWLMCSSEVQWHNKLRTLVADPAARQDYADHIRLTAKRWYDIKNLNKNWIHALQTAVAS